MNSDELRRQLEYFQDLGVKQLYVRQPASEPTVTVPPAAVPVPSTPVPSTPCSRNAALAAVTMRQRVACLWAGG